MLLFGRAQPDPPWSVDVASAYDPATGTWRRLAPLAGPKGNYEGHYSAVWTGKEMLVVGPFDRQAFNPLTNHWRRLPAERGGGAGGLVLWTGHELIDWGGGCCGDASSGGSAYNPNTNRWRSVAPSPLAPSQQPIGAWTGRELIIFVSGLDPDGKPYPARLARAAAYNPKTDTWRRTRPLPALRQGATGVWDGREVPRRGRHRGAPRRETAGAGEGGVRLQPGDEPLAAASAHEFRPHAGGDGVDRAAAAGLGWEPDGGCRPARDPEPRTRLRPGGQPLVATPPDAAARPPRPDGDLDGALDDRLGRTQTEEPARHRDAILPRRSGVHADAVARRAKEPSVAQRPDVPLLDDEPVVVEAHERDARVLLAAAVLQP